MSRKVFITDDMGLDDALVDIAATNPEAAMLWPWIIPYFDDWGRADASPRRIKGKVFPLFPHITPETIGAVLEVFAIAGIITLYEVQGKPFMCVDPEKWFRYQTHIHAEKRNNDKSRNPAPPSQKAAPKTPNRENPAQSRETPRDSAQSRASPSPSPTPSVTLTDTEGSAVEIHGVRPKSQTPPDDEFPPPLPDGPLPVSESQNGLTGSEAHLRPLFAAFRSVRHPKCIPENAPPAEWKSALPWLRLLYEAGASVETMRVATAAALRRWRTPDMVTIKAVAEKWTGLLEPDAAPVEAAPPLRETATQKARRESLERIDRNFEEQVQTYREWEAGSGSPPPGGDSLPPLRIVGGAKA